MGGMRLIAGYETEKIIIPFDDLLTRGKEELHKNKMSSGRDVPFYYPDLMNSGERMSVWKHKSTCKYLQPACVCVVWLCDCLAAPILIITGDISNDIAPIGKHH